MKNPLMPFAAIMAGGIILVFVIAIYGASQGGGSGEKAKDTEKAKQEQTGETANLDPKKLFKGTCAGCHGENLQGGNGPKLADIGKSMSKDDILKQIKNGGGIMPPGLLKGDEAKSVADWLSKKK